MFKTLVLQKIGGHEGLRMHSWGEAAAEIAKGTKYGRTMSAADSLMLMRLRCSDLSTKTFWKLQCDAERIMSDHRHERHQLVRLLAVQPCHLCNMSIHTHRHIRKMYLKSPCWYSWNIMINVAPGPSFPSRKKTMKSVSITRRYGWLGWRQESHTKTRLCILFWTYYYTVYLSFLQVQLLFSVYFHFWPFYFV